MPPLPEIGKPATTGMVDSSAIFAPKKPLQTSDPNPSSNIFASAIKESNVENKVNVFSKPPSGTYKPDLFQSIEPAAKGLFQGGPTTGVKSTFGAPKVQKWFPNNASTRKDRNSQNSYLSAHAQSKAHSEDTRARKSVSQTL